MSEFLKYEVPYLFMQGHVSGGIHSCGHGHLRVMMVSLAEVAGKMASHGTLVALWCTRLGKSLE